LKKLKCIDEFTKELYLNNVFTINDRAEVLAHKKKYRAKFDMIVTRAFAKFSPMIEMTLPFIKEKGYLLSFRGPDNEIELDDKVLDYFGGFCEEIIKYTLPNNEKREIWVIKKVEPFLSHYPRRTGTPKKEPIIFE
jgi:16S rRNA (guanine527-N7)-methyltransferase